MRRSCGQLLLVVLLYNFAHALDSSCSGQSLFICLVGRRGILCGVFSDFSSLSHPLLSTVFQCDGYLLCGGMGAHGWFVKFCQTLVQSPYLSWLPIVEASGCLRHPTST